MSSESPSGVDPSHTVPVVGCNSDNQTSTTARRATPPPLPPASSHLPRYPQTPRKPATAVPPEVNSTPFAARTSGMLDSPHTCQYIYPLVRYDLENYTRTVTIDQWVSSVLNVPPEKITEWSKYLNFKKLLKKSTSIMDNLQHYCEASLEPDRYMPWSAIVNKIVSLAHDCIGDLPDYPLNLTFVRNDPILIGDKGEAQRKPDVVVVHDSFRPDDTKGKKDLTAGISWKDVVACVEFKKHDSTLKAMFQELKAAHKGGARGLKKFMEKKSYPETPQEVGPSEDMATTSRVTSTGSRKRRATKSFASEAAVPSKRSKTISKGVALSAPGLWQSDTDQMASYALELLSSTSGIRMHCLQIYVDGDRMMLWYYDAGGIVHSEWMYWIHELPKFAAIIVAFVQLDLGGWGIGNIPNLTPPLNAPSSTNPLPTSLSGHTLMMTRQTPGGGQEKVEVTLQKEVFAQYSLVGRRTIVYDITTEPQISTRPLVLKISMQTTSRTPEHIFVKDAAENGVRHLPEVHMWSNQDSDSEPEWRLSQGVWGKLFPGKEDQEYEDRCQRIIVFTKYQPIEDIVSPANMHNLLLQLIECIDELRYKACILHRDISLGNLMYEELSDGSIKLILNDFDLAVKVDKDGLPTTTNSSKHRTGTLPFMAHELLNPVMLNSVTHYLRHDFESVFLVALWLTIKFFLRASHGDALAKDEGRSILHGWEYGTLADIYPKKFTLITNDQTMKGILEKVDTGAYRNWISGFWAVLQRAYKARADQMPVLEIALLLGEEAPKQMVDLETFDGLISCDSVKRVLQRWEIAQSTSQAIEGFVPYFVQ